MYQVTLILEFIILSLNSAVQNLNTVFPNSDRKLSMKSSELIIKYFQRLRNYMTGSEHNISKFVDNLFDELLYHTVQLMFIPQSRNDIATAKCIASMLSTENPFAKSPENIKTLMLRTFPPVRIVGNALLIGVEFLTYVLNDVSCDW